MTDAHIHTLTINGVDVPPESHIMKLTIQDIAIINPNLKLSFKPLRTPCVFLDELWKDLTTNQRGT